MLSCGGVSAGTGLRRWTRLQSAQKSAKRSPFLFIYPKPCLPITCSYPLLLPIFALNSPIIITRSFSFALTTISVREWENGLNRWWLCHLPVYLSRWGPPRLSQRIDKLYLFISFVVMVEFERPDCNIVLTFHVPNKDVDFGERRVIGCAG